MQFYHHTLNIRKVQAPVSTNTNSEWVEMKARIIKTVRDTMYTRKKGCVNRNIMVRTREKSKFISE